MQDKLIEKIGAAGKEMEFQIKTLKTLVQVPRLRNQMRFYDFKDLDFKGYLVVVENLLSEVREQLVSEGIMRPAGKTHGYMDPTGSDLGDIADITRRNSILAQMNQTFGFSHHEATPATLMESTMRKTRFTEDSMPTPITHLKNTESSTKR